MQISLPSYKYINVKNISIKINILIKKMSYAVLHYSVRVTCKSLTENFLAIARNTGTCSSNVTDC